VEKRRKQRTRRRITCEILIGDERYAGIVRDVSPAGLFVQTRARPPANSVVEMIFPASDGRREVRVEAGVARERNAPPGLQAEVPGGIGLEVLAPPPEYHVLIAEEAERASREARSAPDNGPPSDSGVRAFRVRLIERGTANHKVLTVRGESAEGARARALTRAGRGWKIAAIQEI
jgi:hypothetical protein